MAEQQQQYSQIYTLGVKAGIKRDGTIFEAREFSDGEWCRFQRGVPKKIGGYREMFSSLNGITRGLIMNSYNGVNYIFTGNKEGIDVFTTGTTLGQGAGPFTATIEAGYSQFAVASILGNDFTITTATDLSYLFPTGAQVIFSQTQPVTAYEVASVAYVNPTLTVTLTAAVPLGATDVWLYDPAFAPDNRLLWQFDMQYSPAGGALKVLAHPGLNLDHIDNAIDSQVLIGDLLPGSPNTWTFTPLADTGGSNPTYEPISVSGGVCVLYPYTFVYGNNGFIANNHVSSTYGTQEINDWNGPTANRVNMTAGKVVKGMPMRGGTNSPSGLFWATDSLIRVSYTGVTNAYWRYDIISSQISIMSSSSVVEMDGVFYWMGVDRFYLYNGSVQVLPNDKNVNWLFNNLNYEQRQKVWATKVPRYNEIWFFYPRGQATECTDAIIYNVKDKLWYDAGEAAGAQRSSGYTTEVFPTPIWADWNYNVAYSEPHTLIATPAGEPAAAANQFYLDGNQTPTFSPGTAIQFSNTPLGSTIYYVSNATFIFNTTIGGAGATLVTCTENFTPAKSAGDEVYTIFGGYGIYQHEYGVNNVTLNRSLAIRSSITTCDISWVGGSPSEDTSVGINRRMHLRRVEPDFVQTGDMTMTIIGHKFAQSATEQNSGPYTFGPDTEKIDLRVEDREIRLKFESDTLNGNYEMGRILITAETGDERP